VQRFAVAHCDCVQACPDNAPIFALEANVGLEQLLVASRVAPFGDDALAIFGMDGFAPVGAQCLTKRQARYFVICGVGVDAFTRLIGNEDSEWRRIADRAK
jgi:hypothetical protein